MRKDFLNKHVLKTCEGLGSETVKDIKGRRGNDEGIQQKTTQEVIRYERVLDP